MIKIFEIFLACFLSVTDIGDKLAMTPACNLISRMTILKWVGSRPAIQTWGHKQDMPAHLRGESHRVKFRFETVYVAININREVLMRDGSRMPVCKFFLKTPGAVLGAMDAQAGANESWAIEWQTAYHDMRIDQLNMRMACTQKG